MNEDTSTDAMGTSDVIEPESHPKPFYERQKEAAWWRHVAILRAQGKTYRAIADELDKTAVTIADICRHEVVRKMILEELDKISGSKMEKRFKVEVDETIEVITNIRDNAMKESDKLKACELILDRAAGKATQKTEVSVKQDPKDIEDVNVLDAQIVDIQKRLEDGSNRPKETSAGTPSGEAKT